MRTSSANLALRDPAMAALLAGATLAGSDMGADFGEDFGDEGDEWAGEFGVDAPAPPMSPQAIAASVPHAELVKTYATHHAGKRKAARRELILDPNKGSSLKIEGYDFSINFAIVLGAGGATAFSVVRQPAVKIRCERFEVNAPSYGFVTLTTIQVSNVNALVGGLADAGRYSQVGVGTRLSLPTIEPYTPVTVSGNYTGFVPPGFAIGQAYTLSFGFLGPARVAG